MKGCLHNGWSSEASKINGMKSCLEGTAIKWYNSMLHDRTEELWSIWKRSFLQSFGQNRLLAATAADKWEYRGGNPSEYFFEKQRLIQIGYPTIDEQSFITKILLGFPDDIQQQLMNRSISTRAELREAINQVKPLSNKTTAEQAKKFSAAVNLKSTRTQEALLSEKFEHDISGVITGEKCSFLDSRQTIIVAGLPYETRLDSGADINLMKRSVAQNSGVKFEDCLYKAKGFSGDILMINECIHADVELLGMKKELEFGIVDNLPYALIVSESGLRNFGIGLTREILITESGSLISNELITNLFPNIIGEDWNSSSGKVKFELKPDHNIVKSRPYRLNSEKYDWLTRKIRELLCKKIISPSSSHYASPVTMVQKANKDRRLCMDYRKINNETDQDPFPFPSIDDIISNLGGCSFFSKIDLKDGFWQLELTKETRKFSSFVTPFGQYEWNRLPFGWRNSPALFQRRMTEILGDILDDPFIWIYVDDICIGGRNREECYELSLKVLKRLNECKVKINQCKCEFLAPKIKFLGRIIDGYTKTTKEESIIKVQSMKRPGDLQEIRRFTGLTGHFRAFINNYAEIVRPLDRLKQKDIPFIWTDACEEAFSKLKCMITANPILQLPDRSLPYELCTDASHSGTGSILYQRDLKRSKNQQLRVIGYQSYTFTKAETNYAITEKEALAVIKAIKYFQSYLEGKKFVVHTDHIALKYLMDLKAPRGRLARWQTFLMGYDIRIDHKPGRLLTDADAISRLCLQNEEERTQETALLVSSEEPQGKVNDTKDVNEEGKLSSRRLIISSMDKLRVLRRYHDDKDMMVFCVPIIKSRQDFIGPK